MSHQPIYFLINRPIPTDFGIGGNRWESLGKMVWCELGLIGSGFERYRYCARWHIFLRCLRLQYQEDDVTPLHESRTVKSKAHIPLEMGFALATQRK